MTWLDAYAALIQWSVDRKEYSRCLPAGSLRVPTVRAPESELLAASRLFLAELETRILQREDFAFETTLAGRSYLKLVHRLRDDGWRVELIYLALPDISMSRLRVAERVAHGGHSIANADIERRFARSLRNLLEVFSPVVDNCRCFMNSGTFPELIFEQQGQMRNVIQADFYQHLLQEAAI